MWAETREGRADMSVAGQRALWRAVWKFLKKLKIELPYDTVILLLACPKKTIIQKVTCTPVFIRLPWWLR